MTPGQSVVDRDDAPVEPAATDAVAAVYRAANALRYHLEHTVLSEHELSWTAWVLLRTIHARGVVEPRHLAEDAAVTKGTVTGVLATLEARCLVERRGFPGDGRRMLVSLTSAGREVIRDATPEFTARAAAALTPLCEAETVALTECLKKLAVALRESPGTP